MSRMGPRKHVLDGVKIPQAEWATFGVAKSKTKKLQIDKIAPITE